MAHIVDLTHFLVGPIERLSGRTATHIPRRPAQPMGEGTHFTRVETDELVDVENEDWASALIEFPTGVVGSLETSRVIVGPHVKLRFEIHGTRGALAWELERMNELERFRFGDDEGYTRVFAGPQHPGFAAFQPGAGIPMGYDDLRVLEAAHFLGAVRDGEQRAPGLDEMVATAHVLDAIERSAESGAWEATPASARPRRDRGRQRPAQLRGLRDDGRDRLPGAGLRARAGRDRARRATRARTSGRPATSGDVHTLRRPPRRPAARRRLRAGRVQRARRDLARPARDARPVRRGRGARRAAGAVRRRRPGARREPGRRRRARARRRPLAPLVDGVARAADIARERGYEPVFHHHTSTYVEGVPEIERFLEDTDVPLLLDSGHLLVGGGDPLTALADWRDRIGAVHIKDARLDVVAAVKAERADTLTAWRRGMFCALGEGDVDLAAFCAALRDYDGWVVVEQDRVLADLDGDFDRAAAEQVANREWLREHAGW